MKGLGLGLAACVGLVGCSAGPGVDIAAEVMPSVVLITYGDGPGHGSGFFVEGEPGVCTVLTANHVVQASPLLLISAYDTDNRGQPWRAEQILPFPNGVDLAVVTFRPAGNRCPYRALKLGNSDRVGVMDTLVTVGYPVRAGEQQLIKQASEIKISSVNPPSPEGYSLFYGGTTARGMSGGPLVDRQGRVVGIHAGSDADEVALAAPNGDPQTYRAETFKWAVPIKFFQASFDTVVANAPPISDGAALRQQGWQHWETKDYSAMLAAFEQAIAANGQDAEAWAGKGTALNELGRDGDSLAAYDQALIINPNYAEVWTVRGITLNELSRNDEALVSYDKALEIRPEFALAWMNRGNALSDLGRYEEALISHDQALAINPDDAMTWMNRGNTLTYLGRLEEALASYDKALAINPNYTEAWYNRGVSLMDLRRPEEALASYDKVLLVKPDFANAWDNRGVALGTLGRYEEALASYDKAIAINSENAITWTNRGIVLALLGRDEEALASCDKALAINPNDESAQRLKQLILSEM
ncbi:MAG: tetratricopeptide repeat protein [Spirulina sp.]